MKKNKNMRPDGSRPQKKDDPAQYSLDEILEEARRLRETSGILPPAPDEDFPLSPEEKERLDALYSPEKAGSAATDDPAAAPLEEVPASPEDAPGAGDDPPDEERDIPSDPEGEDGSESARSLDDGGAPEETTASSRPSKKNSLFRSLREKWERRREEPLFPKDLPDYSKYPMLSSVPRRTEDEAPDFSYLFGEELEEADDEVFDLHFEEIREARRKRVEQASSLAGVQQEDLFSITRTIDIERPGDTIAFRLDRKDRDQTIETPPVEDGAEKADSTAIAAETSESAAETAEKALPADSEEAARTAESAEPTGEPAAPMERTAADQPSADDAAKEEDRRETSDSAAASEREPADDEALNAAVSQPLPEEEAPACTDETAGSAPGDSLPEENTDNRETLPPEEASVAERGGVSIPPQEAEGSSSGGQQEPVSKYEKHFGKPKPLPASGLPAEKPETVIFRRRSEAAGGLYTEEAEAVRTTLPTENPRDVMAAELQEYHRSEPQSAAAAPAEEARTEEASMEGPESPAPSAAAPLPAAEEAFSALPGEEAYAPEPEPASSFPMQEEAAPKRRRGRFRFAIFGDEEEETDPADAMPEEEPEIEDYTNPEDASSVRAEIAGNLRSLLLRLLVTGAVGLLLFFFALSTQLGWGVTASMSLSSNPIVYLTVNNALLLFALLFSWGTIANGFSALFHLQGNSDSALALASAAVFLQGTAAMCDAPRFADLGLHSYAVLVVFGLFLNTLGKIYLVNRVRENFKFVCSPDQKYAVKRIDDRDQSRALGKGIDVEEPVVAYHTKTNLLSSFLELSYAPDPSEKAAHNAAPIGMLCSLAVGIVSFIVSKDLFSALTAFAAAACICVPMACVLAINVPIRRLCKRALRMGAMLIGYPAVQHFGDTTALVLDAEELFPAGSVVLHGMKTFGGQRVDDVILDAAAVICKAGGPLAGVFEQIIKGRHEMLPKVDSIVYEDELGFIAWVGGKRTLIGTRRLLEEHGIAPPSRDYEAKYQKGARQLTYLATGGELVAMFVVSYLPDEKIAPELQRLEDNGVCFLVRTADSNITPRLVADAYSLFYRNIKILPHAQAAFYGEARLRPEERTRAYLATRGERLPALARMLSACIRLRGSLSLAVVLQVIGVVIGFLLVAFLTFYAGLPQLGALELMLYLAFWVLAALVVPSLRRP